MFWFKNIEKIKKQHEEEFLQRANVVGIGMGFKQIKGKWTKKKAIICFVEKKKDLPELMAVDVVPKKIEGVTTDIIEVGELWEMQDRDRYRPAPGGCSAMHSRGTACTLGCVVYKNGKTYLLGNQHCYLPKYKGIQEGAPILQPSLLDGGKIEDKIAVASETIEFDLEGYNLIDAALAEVINPDHVEQRILDIGEISPQTAGVKVGEEVQKRGRTSLYTQAKVIAVDVTAMVNYGFANGEKKTIRFEDQIFTEPFVEVGDSSSLALNIDYRDWYRKYVELYKEAKAENKYVDVNVFRHIEQDWEVPIKTQKLAEFLKEFYADSVPVMKPQALRKKYITHTPRTFMERVKSKGLLRALKEVVVPNIAPQENISPDIELALDYIVSKEKFNPFALPREEYAKYSRQLQKTVKAYASLYFYKKHFDPIIPKVLTMKSFLPPNKQKYVRKWLQTIGGRPMDYWIWRGRPMRVGRRAINSAVRFEYATLLGLNVSSGFGNAAGGNWNNVADIPKGKLTLGNKRLFTRQGRKLIDKYGLAEQTLYLEPVGGRLENLTKAERALFIFMQMGEFQMRGSAALSVISENEFRSGELSSETRAKIRRQIARTQGLFGPAQAPLITQTTVGRPFAMFKHWMINEMELWHSFVRESAKSIKERPDLYKNPVKNPGMRRILKYVLVGIVLATFSPSFFKKEVWQKMGIPISLLKTAFDRAEAPLMQDVMFAGTWLNYFVRGEVEESKDEFIRWFKNISPEAKKVLESTMGEIRTSRGALVRKMSLAERFKHLLFGRYTKEGQKSQELDEMIDEIWPTESHYKYSFLTGTSRRVKTKYQAIKEKIIDEIERKKYRNIKQVKEDRNLSEQIRDYNKKAVEQLDKWVEETEKFYKVKITAKNYDSKLKRVTIQPDDVERWMEVKIKKETVPAALRR